VVVDGYLVSDAAEVLGVAMQQVHRWIKTGVLATETDSSGRHWIPAHEVAYLAKLPGERRRGRPPTQHRVWDELFDIEAHVSGPGLDRLKNRRWFSYRSTRHAGWSEEAAIRRLRGRNEVMNDGTDAAGKLHAPVVPERGPWDLYFPHSMIDECSRRPLLRRPASQMNLVLHFVEDESFARVQERFGRVMPATVAWLDLADANDRAAPEMWSKLVGRWR